MREPPYFIGYGRFRQFVHRIVTGKYFDLVIALVIGLNVITMSLEHYLMPMELVYALKLFNFIFSSVFVVEAFMKAIALGLGRYLKDKWNQLDVLIVILSIIGIILEEMESTLIPINPTIIRVMRVARIARVLKLLKMANGIRQLLDTVMQALPQVGNLGLLFFLLFFIFAALGTELFGRLECDEEHPCQGLGEHAHFQNFGMAFLTLFRVATGDNWNGIMKDTLRDKCDASSDCLQNCCISPIIAPLYFVIFVLMAQFVLVNVVVAVLMKHLEESHKQMDEDEDHEIDMEIAKEIEAEKKALIEAIERRKRETDLKVRRPLMKMASLPSNFTFSVLSLKERSKSEAENSFQWANKAKIFHSNIKSPEQIELENISKLVVCEDSVCQSNAKTGNGIVDSVVFHYPLKSSITCDSIFGSNSNKWNLAKKHDEQSPSLRCPYETSGILKKSHSLRVKNSKTFLIDSFKRSPLYCKNQTDGKNLNRKKNEDEEAFLFNLDEDEDVPLKSANLHISKSTETISDFGKRSCRQRANRAFIMNGHQSRKNNPNRGALPKLPFNNNNNVELVSLSGLHNVQSPVTIKIDNCSSRASLCGSPNLIKQSSSDNPPPPQPPTPVRCEFLATYTPTSTTSPSRINIISGHNHRKLSDFLDEESAPLSPSLFGVYPEFSNDVTTCDEELNVLDEDDGNEEMSLASAESWPSTEMPESSSLNIVIDMQSIESKKS